jgi:septal ring factor EnvC (AmiA/AmiB activator)
VPVAAVKPAVVKPTSVKPVEQKKPVMPPPVTAPTAKPLPLIKPVTASPSVAVAPLVSAPKPSPKKNIIELPAINDNAAPASIELTVNKDHQVVVQTVAQAAKQNTASNVKTIPLTLPARSATVAASAINIAPSTKMDKPTAVTTVAAARETAKASHSLIQTLKDSLCKKYAHFCGHTDEQTANEQLDLSHIAFTSLQGKLSWPTAGKVLTHFGAELGDSNLKYNGVLIQAPAGQPIHAIYAGRVIFANWLQGLGLLLIIDHGNGYMSLYGHNAALYKKVGDSVKPNDLIASVGDSGVPGPIGLYFEIRHNGQPVNPDAWCS